MMQKAEMRAYSVTQINNYLQRMIHSDYSLRRIKVVGELSNVKYHYTDNIFFTLKDEKSALTCMMYANRRKDGLAFALEDGQRVVVEGYVDVYVERGVYELYAQHIQKEGAGELNECYQRLLAKLDEEGLFDFEHKKPIPTYATKIGIVTASTGAAIHDITSNIYKRNPYVKLYFCPAKVQGQGAAESIVRGIHTLDKLGLDVIIIGRGGGSMEDLWAFNEECLAYAIYEANTPIVSGTGHEPDTTIADYVADKRAATPTAAAIMVTFDYADYRAVLSGKNERMDRLLKQRLERYGQRLKVASLRLEHASPKARLDRQKEQTAMARARMEELMTQRVEKLTQRLERMQPQLRELTAQNYKRTQNRLLDTKQRLPRVMTQRVVGYRHALEVSTARLHGVSPTAKLLHGFGYVEKDGAPVTDINKLKKGDRIAVTMHNGTKPAEIL